MNDSITQPPLNAIQSDLGEPLRSEQRAGELLPPVLSSLDLLVIFIAIVLFIPNASIVQATQGAGATVYIYWIIGTVTFLLPGAVVTSQLNHFIPSEGSIYVWTHRALGPLWGFFAGFCAWIPGVLALLASSVAVVNLLQGTSLQIWHTEISWLDAPWQEGIVVLSILLATAWAATRPLARVMRVAKWLTALYGAAILIVGLAGVTWLLRGHTFPFSFTTRGLSFGGQNIVLYGVIILALLGIEVPFNMSAETRHSRVNRLFLRWGPILVLIAYLLGTFGVMAVVPGSLAGESYSTLIAVNMVFGTPFAVLIGVIFIAFFLMVTILYQIAFARLLFVPALDHRLPITLAHVNRHATPAQAIHVQCFVICCIALFIYFIGPFLYAEEGADFPYKVYTLSQATTTVIWCISMVILFLDLPLLLRRFRKQLAQRQDKLIVPSWLLYLCCIVGGMASLLGIWTTVSSSWDTTLLPNNQWSALIITSTLIVLGIGLIGSAYPRLLSSLEEQTAVANENAHLYNELRAAYAKLSELDELKDAFIRTANHELRTPLTIVQGYLELLSVLDDADVQTRHNFLEKACRACDELVVLQANIMDVSRIEFDHIQLNATTIALQLFVKMIVDLFEPSILNRRYTITISIDETIKVWADEICLRQILHNLISNALHYSPPQTPIHITASSNPEEQMVRIQVIDRGSGIPPDKQKAIFDKFVRLERDMHGTTRGSGLGLFITRQLVEAMNGTISVESSGIEGEGSTVSFTLPLREKNRG